MSFLQEEPPPHSSRAAREVTLLSWERWGVGSLVTIAVFLGGGMLLLFRWTGTKGLFSLTMAVILLVGAGVIFVVKAAENIERMEFGGYDPVGKIGVVTAAMGVRSTSFVRVMVPRDKLPPFEAGGLVGEGESGLEARRESESR